MTPRQPGASAQIVRMLALVPYISRRPGVRISELAAEFGVTSAQITADLNVLMMCGEPGYYPGDLIDVLFDDEDGSVSIGHDAGLAQPVRLTQDEAVTLSVALRVLADLPGLVDGDAVHSVLEKLEGMAGGLSAAVVIAPQDPGPALAPVRQAIDERRRIRITYYTASRDEISQRDVDPMRVFVVDGRSYLEGYCYRAQATRRFRMDRIDHVELLAAAVQEPLWHEDAVPESLFTPGRDGRVVTVDLAPEAIWVAEYYAAELVSEIGGIRRVRLVAPGDEWIVRLLLSLGGAARIIDEPEIAAEVGRRATEALAAYAEAGTDDH